MNENTDEILEFEEKNFRVDSAGWEKIWKGWFGRDSYLLNPEGDICEFLHGKYKGEQLFCWHAAKRETYRAGKIMMGSYEWHRLRDAGKDMPNVVFAGRYCVRVYRAVGDFSGFEDQGKLACFWFSDDRNSNYSDDASGYYISADKVMSPGSLSTPRNYALSVRCVKKTIIQKEIKYVPSGSLSENMGGKDND